MSSPLQQFFDGYPTFSYDPQQPASSEFQRLAKAQGWGKKSQARAQAYAAFKDALVAQFNANFGVDENSLTGWQALCEVLGVEPIPQTVKEARKVR